MNASSQTLTLGELEAYSNKLVEKQILNEKGKALLLKAAKAKEIEVDHRSTVKQIDYTEDDLTKETILEFCARAFKSSQAYRIHERTKTENRIPNKESLGRTSWTYSLHDALGGLRDGKDDYLPPTRSTIGYTRLKTLEDFKTIGLISDLVYNDCKAGLTDIPLFDECELLQYMVHRSMYYRFYEFNKKEQLEYIDKLVNAGILNNQKRNVILKAYTGYNLLTIPQILEYSNRYIVVNLEGVQADPEIIYPIIFDSAKKLLPEFNYHDLKIEVIKTKDSDLIRHDVKLSFIADGNSYTQTFFQDYRKQVPDSSDVPSRLGEDFHKPINKWLTDRESSYRFYRINLPQKGENVYGDSRVGLLLLKEGEADIVTKEVYLISRESFDNRISRKNFDYLVSEFADQGFFKHLTGTEIDSAKKVVASSNIGSLEDILLHFPKTIVFFDWETGNLENPYEEHTKQFAEASRGAFSVDNVIDEYKKGWKTAKQTKYGFTFNGKRYETMLKFEGDWLDPEFMEMIKRALKENSVDGDIYQCVDDGQAAGYIFLSAGQYKFLKEKYPDLIKE